MAPHGSSWPKRRGVAVTPVSVRQAPTRAPPARAGVNGEESDRLGCPNLAPATGRNSMSGEDVAAGRGIPRLAQVLRAGAAFLSGLVGGVRRGVHLRRI